MVKAILLLFVVLMPAIGQAETYAHWIASYGLTGADAAPDADPDHDGIPNLMEYALEGLNPTVNNTNHASLPKFGYVRRTGARLGQWEWAGSLRPPTDGLNGKWHSAIRFTARPGVEAIRYTPQLSDVGTLRRWFDGRSAIYSEVYPGNVIQSTAITIGNRNKRFFMRLQVRMDDSVDGSLAGIHIHSFAPQALVVGTPTSLSRAVTSPSTSTLDIQDRHVLRTTGANTVTDFTWHWDPAPTNIQPVNVSRTTGNASVIIPDATDPYRWTYVGTGTASITIRTDSSTYTGSVTTSTATGGTSDVVTGYLTGSLRTHLATGIDAEIAGKTPSAALPIFSAQDHTTPSYTRNTGCWGAAYVSALTSISPWNSQGGAHYAGILISPRHVLFAQHYCPAAGATIRFITADNTVVTRTLSSIQHLTQSQSYYPDLSVGKLDSDVPGTISFARILPDTFANNLPSLASYPVPCAATDQEEKLLVREVTAIPTSTASYAQVTMQMPQDAARRGFYEDIVGGDSGNPAFLIVNNQLVLLTCWTFGGGGSGSSVVAFKTAINAAMTSLGGGYTLTAADFSGFPSY